MDDPCPNSSSQVNYLQWAIPMIETNADNGCTTILEKSQFLVQKIGKYSKKFKDINLKKVMLLCGMEEYGTSKEILLKREMGNYCNFYKMVL